MTNGLDGLGNGSSTREEQMALQQIAIANAELLRLALPHAPMEELVTRLVQAFVTQQDIASDVLGCIADPALRASHPIWGVKIVRASDQVQLAHVYTRKELDPKSATYARELGNWLLIYAYATMPAARVGWSGVGVGLDFYQAKDDQPKPLLVDATGSAVEK